MKFQWKGTVLSPRRMLREFFIFGILGTACLWLLVGGLYIWDRYVDRFRGWDRLLERLERDFSDLHELIIEDIFLAFEGYTADAYLLAFLFGASIGTIHYLRNETKPKRGKGKIPSVARTSTQSTET